MFFNCKCCNRSILSTRPYINIDYFNYSNCGCTVKIYNYYKYMLNIVDGKFKYLTRNIESDGIRYGLRVSNDCVQFYYNYHQYDEIKIDINESLIYINNIINLSEEDFTFYIKKIIRTCELMI